VGLITEMTDLVVGGECLALYAFVVRHVVLQIAGHLLKSMQSLVNAEFFGLLVWFEHWGTASQFLQLLVGVTR